MENNIKKSWININAVTKKIRDSRFTKGFTFFLAIEILVEIAAPSISMAMTTGPSQPEVQSFEPVQTTDMVNLFTGDFTYNIPLMNVPGPNGGYPINIAYHAGVGLEQEASWVGLGWNINPGALIRNVRGYADDYNGDEIISKMDMKDNITFGLGPTLGAEVIGADGDMPMGLGVTVKYNNFKGFGVSLGLNMQVNDAMSMGLSLDSESGLGFSASYSRRFEKCDEKIQTYGLSYSNEGFGLDFSRSKSFVSDINEFEVPIFFGNNWKYLGSLTVHQGILDNGSTGGSAYTYTQNTYMPQSSMPMYNDFLSVSIKPGVGSGTGIFGKIGYNGFYQVQSEMYYGRKRKINVYGYENLQNSKREDYTDFTREKDGKISPQSPNLAIPSLTHDTYMVLGQGMSGAFRAYRTDVGSVYDPYLRNNIKGKSVSYDLGVNHIGSGGTITTGYDVQRAYTFNNDWLNKSGSEYENFIFRPKKEEGSTYKYKDRERVYYRMTGDKSTYSLDELDYIGGYEAIHSNYTYAPPIDKIGELNVPTNIKNDRALSAAGIAEKRISRNYLVHKFANFELTEMFNPGETATINDRSDLEGKTDISETSIFYYDASDLDAGQPWLVSGASNPADPDNFLQRDTRNGNSVSGHNGAYKVLNENGEYYVYALPAYNNSQTECIHSTHSDLLPTDGGAPNFNSPVVEIEHELDDLSDDEVKYRYGGTDKFLDKTIKPPYTHSHLLTSILGADYIDIDGNGPSDDDLGYWVKFEYLQYTDEYKWRDPFSGSTYIRGNTASAEDDKGTYMYGTKELWYLTRIETKTHIAVFDLCERNDSYEAASEFNNNNDLGTNSGLLLKSIKLYLKEDYLNNASEQAIPLQEVHFSYDYSLCQGIPNNDGESPRCSSATSNETGKLTLKKISFSYQGSSKGALRPYSFEYNNTTYDQYAMDRWGNYKSGMNDFEKVNVPYVDQYQNKNQHDENAGQWSLSKITLPSGSEMNIDYEADDYAYVQNVEAAQMMEITAVNDETLADDVIFEDGLSPSVENPTSRRVYFKLENPIATSLFANADEEAEYVYQHYVENIIQDENEDRNLYFKLYANLKDEIYDYVGGYIPIERYEDNWQINYGGTNYYKYGLTGASAGNYTEGFITIQKYVKKRKYNNSTGLEEITYQDKYHPFANTIWNHIRFNDSKLLTAGVFADLESGTPTKSFKAGKAVALLGFIPSTIQMFSKFERYCYGFEFGNKIDLSKSYIRLTSSDGVKHGGGHRVAQISVSDKWNEISGEASAEYGVTYDYTMEEEYNGSIKSISSGVAQYEPLRGGDEIALRYPRHYVDNIPMKSNSNTFFENPINEGLYPGSIVGYRKVSVASINTKNQMDVGVSGSGIGTSGIAEYEFYTAKEFPVIVKQTEIIKEKRNLQIPIPFIGVISDKKIKAIQGYAIELNDMHGKPKSIKQFGIEADYSKSALPTAQTTYNYYADDNFILDEKMKPVQKLQNNLPTLNQDNNSGTPVTENRLIGIEYDFVTDQRQNKSNVKTVGAVYNVDPIVIFGITLPSWWPQYSSYKQNFMSSVTNKVIFRSGIIKSVQTYDGQSNVIMESKIFDAETGRPVITTLTNEFESTIYKYSHPAHWEYDGMGGAYQNIDLEFEGKIVEVSGTGGVSGTFIFETDANALSQLVKGDILSVSYNLSGDSEDDPKQRYWGTYLGTISTTEGIIFVEKGSVAETRLNIQRTNDYMGDFKVIRSGRRNHVLADAGQIVSLSDPLSTRGSNTISISENSGGSTYTNSLTVFNMDNVINSTAVVYKDNWEQLNNGGSLNKNENPYLTGESGVWRPYKSYVYVGERDNSQSNTYSRTKVAENGTMDDVEFFNWQVNDFEKYASNWEWSSEVIKFNKEAYEIENIDRLGIRSAALFGYEGGLALAVGGNAGYHEIGCEDFERYPVMGAVSSTEQEFDDNIGFFNQEITGSGNYTQSVNREFSIIGGEILTSGQVRVMLDSDVAFSISDLVDIAIQTSNFTSGGKADRYIFNAEVLSSSLDGSNRVLTLQTGFIFGSTYYSMLQNGSFITGRLTSKIDRTVPMTLTESNYVFVDSKAHTGSQSLQFKGNGLFPQGRIDLIPNKTYVFSAWVSMDDERRIDYSEVELDVRSYNGSGWVSIQDVGTYTKSKLVEGWQKIEFEFTPTTDDLIGIYLESLSGGSEITAYIDDIRISPKTGGIVTYVYNNNNFRLEATLDPNNYATFYFYDEEGNLHLVKRETERGIQTVSENRGNTRVTP